MFDDDKHILEHAAVLNHLPHKLKTHNILLLPVKYCSVTLEIDTYFVF